MPSRAATTSTPTRCTRRNRRSSRSCWRRPDSSRDPGCVATVNEAKRRDVKLGFVTTTSPENISALLEALSPDIDADTFDLIVDRDSVGSPKPDAASYLFALEQLGENADAAVAIEDNVGGVAAASAAGVKCVAFPNENTVDGDFAAAAETVESLDAEQLVGLVA